MIAARLVAEGVAPQAAMGAARAAHGDLERARVLATDPALAERRAAFADAPHVLDGTGAVAMRTAAHLLGLIDAASEPLIARHAAEAGDPGSAAIDYPRARQLRGDHFHSLIG